ncbi:hypothetical protein ABEB36_012152 [Hypothenemus hampei]|uniref:CWH43-like N-terminal domain-containing protein n=1 Tax=Hypothenemus hampei TaxID=57062 RepID=A0ABD1EA85_HYPHA
MPFKYLHVIPITQGLIFSITSAFAFIMAVFVNKDVPPVFPYISDVGVWSLERCIFTIGMDFGALFCMATLYIRYRQVIEILDSKRNELCYKRLKILNRISLYLSVLSQIGVVILAAFPDYPYFVPHLIGASSAFGCGIIFIAIQTYISFKLYPHFGKAFLNNIRLLLLVITFIALIVTSVAGTIAFSEFKGGDYTQWTKESGGYDYHLISVGGEWVLAPGLLLYIALYSIEFKHIILHNPSIEAKV